MTNGGWLDSNTADGMRLSLADEFSDIYVLNLRGNQRTAGEQSRREGGKVFGGGSRATVAVTVLVKDPDNSGPARIHYTDIGDYLTREDKLAKTQAAQRVTGLEPVTRITPNVSGDWINQRRSDFGTFLALGDKRDDLDSIFHTYAYPLLTARDAWVYGSSVGTVGSNVQMTIAAFNRFDGNDDPAEISWSETLRSRAKRRSTIHFHTAALRSASYRPFNKQVVYFSDELNHRRGLLPRLFPVAKTSNSGIQVTGIGSTKPFTPLLVDAIPDLAFWGSGSSQFFARWRYEKVEAEEGMLSLDTANDDDAEAIDGYRRIDNITDHALTTFRAAYGDRITKDDIFFYVYGLLHSPDYRETYAADLKKVLPRIPLVTDPWPYVEAGRRLSELHLGYESVDPYPLAGLDDPAPTGDAAYDHFRVEKMAFAKVRDPETKKLVADRSTVVYNSRITLSGIPEDAYRYQLGSRSAIEWILDRYQVKVDGGPKGSGIVNDPNDWSRDVRDPRYIIDLLARIVTVSLETLKIVDALPPLDIRSETT